MKKVANILLTAVLMAGLLSCAKTDRIYDDTKTEIAMKPVMHTPTKEIVEGTTYPTGVNFGVLAYYSSAYGDQDKWTDLTGENAPVPYIDDQEFVSQGDGTFGGSDPCYWPQQGSLVFAGYSPYYAQKESVSFDPDTKTLTIAGFESDGQTDLMYFLPEVSDNSLVGLNSGASSVPAVFSHALSLVEFNVKGVDNDETVKLWSITFKDIPHMGTLTANASACSWSDQSSPDDLPVFSSVDGVFLSSETPVTATILVIPGDAADIELKYDAIGVSTHDKTGTIKPGNAVTKWVAGKKYIYNLTIRSGIIIIDSLSVYDYPEIDGPDTEIEI